MVASLHNLRPNVCQYNSTIYTMGGTTNGTTATAELVPIMMLRAHTPEYRRPKRTWIYPTSKTKVLGLKTAVFRV